MHEQKRRLWPWGLLVVLITAGLVYFMFATRSQPPQREVVENSFTVDVRVLKQQNIAPEVPLLGVIESTQQTQVRSRLNATVETLHVLEGDNVVAGEPLLSFNEAEAVVPLTQRRSEVAELKALIAEQSARAAADRAALKTEQRLLALNEKAVKRQESLSRANVSSQEQLEAKQIALAQQQLALVNREFAVQNAENQLAQLQARLDRAEAQLALAELDYAQVELLAPFDARVASVNVAAGDRVNVSEPLMQLVGLDSLEVRAQIPNRWVPAVQRALTAGRQDERKTLSRAQALVFGKAHELLLKRMAAQTNAGTGGIDAFFAFVSEPPFSVNKAVPVILSLPPLEKVYTVPESAIYGDNTVYIVEDGRMQPRAITRLGRFTGPKGLEQVIFRFDTGGSATDVVDMDGVQVVATQLPTATTGQLVKVREPSDSSATVR
ncbi:efflux RND transporter periplasmic adaptor subunit [Allohahella sp. A8]|uniref:efflux RND transporter periplasmic adaptor subunit n=1 Tax=Allohahella sp. A8 TaxID=3141461 RepID=UPI003A813B65